MGRYLVLAGAGLGLALALSACANGPTAEEKAAAEKAQAQKVKEEAIQAKADYKVRCLSALHWQEKALAGAGVGPVQTYADYFDKELVKDVGSEVILNDKGGPALSAATMADYLNWSYPHVVEKDFVKDKDADGDGKVTTAEKNARGYGVVAACVQQAAEAGIGPLAGPDKVGRMFKIQALQDKLKKSGV